MKQTSIKKMLALFLIAAVMLAAFTACAEKAPDTAQSQQPASDAAVPADDKAAETSTATPEEPVTINFWHHYSAQSAENETLMNVLIPKFEEENPGYKVNAVSHEWADLHDKILVSASSNTLPDVARLDIAWVPEFQKMNILIPLDQQMGDFNDVAGQLLPSAMSTAVVKGSYYALALNTNTKILFYNADALAEAGIEVPKTMDEMFAAIHALSGTNANGQQVWGLNEPALAGWNVLPYIWSNGGNITVNITEHVDDAIRAMEPVSGRFPIGTTLPRLKGCYFFCKGTNKRMRDLARRPMENGSVIRILDDCASYEIIADKAVKPTSELASHLAMHNQMIASGNGYKAALHTHPIDLIAMTHNPAFLEKDVLTNLLWSMIPETRAFCPKGLGIVPYKMPSSVELAEATIAQLREYDVVMWEKHGVCAVGPDIFEAFDQVDVLSKSAQIYLTARSMGFEPAGTTQEQMDELKRAFNL